MLCTLSVSSCEADELSLSNLKYQVYLGRFVSIIGSSQLRFLHSTLDSITTAGITISLMNIWTLEGWWHSFKFKATTFITHCSSRVKLLTGTYLTFSSSPQTQIIKWRNYKLQNHKPRRVRRAQTCYGASTKVPCCQSAPLHQQCSPLQYNLLTVAIFNKIYHIYTFKLQ